MAIQNRRTRRGVFEISNSNGLISLYSLRRVRGKGGKADPKLEALLAHHAQRLKEKQETTKLVSSASSKSQLSEVKPPSRELKFQLATTVDKRPQKWVMVLLILAVAMVSLLMSWL